MKKVRFSLLLAISLVSCLTSCQKRHCWTCVIVAVTVGGGTANTITNRNICDKTKSEIRVYQRVTSGTRTDNGATVTTTVSCKED